MQFDILTIFPQQMQQMLDFSILGRAMKSGKIVVNTHDLRKWTEDTRQTVDDRPFGGSPGMLLMLEPVYKALKELKVYPRRPHGSRVILTSAAGSAFDQNTARTWQKELTQLIIICGHYEGVDQRIVDHLIDAQVSIGPYVLTGGEIAAAVITETVSRLIPGVLGNEFSLTTESFDEKGVTEYPQYTRPAKFLTAEGDEWTVPEVLLSGNHAQIADWKKSHLKTDTRN